MNNSVFTNSCTKVPVHPKTKLPNPAYVRINNMKQEQCSIDSPNTFSVTTPDGNVEKVKDFYKSIPDYNEINHLSSSEFYSTLKSLREKKKSVLRLTVEDVNETPRIGNKQLLDYEEDEIYARKHNNVDLTLANNTLKVKPLKVTKKSTLNSTKNDKNCQRTKPIAINNMVQDNSFDSNQAHSSDINIKKVKEKGGSKRNHSACSISWHDDKVEMFKNDVDKKFEKFFHGQQLRTFESPEFRTQSMPSSPLRSKSNRKSSNTIPNLFKMSERDAENRIIKELRTLQKSFSEDMLNQKRDRKQFRARPVPIESRIPLYDKILEDQAMRRAITKINSEAELRAQMKPFSFTTRDEIGAGGLCERAAKVLPKPRKKKHFRARPVPKNLFSNYFYEKAKQDDFFRCMNRRIRAEEMLRNANYPGHMGARERSRLSTPAAHSDLPTDPSPAAPSSSSSDRMRCTSPTKMYKLPKDDFVTTSPQPFKLRTASRANQKMLNMAQKVYQSGETSVDLSGTVDKSRAYSALELKSAAVGRSNLAALLRAESVRRRFELEAARSLSEQRRRLELRQRDRQLRSKPAWHLVKNNHEEDIAMRLQTRRDEERMRQEEFLHEMELMYGRVQQQPLLFERYYAPRLYSSSSSIQLSPRKSKKRSNRKSRSFHMVTPSNGYDDLHIKGKKNGLDDKFNVNSEEVIDSVERMCL